ncbi:hypothetical protein M8J75_006434 [Diaphorina citri]|nr:hypothetical protein M8J75_006434 [Diaphorina citri]
MNSSLGLTLTEVFLETRVVSNLLLAIKNVCRDPAQLNVETDASGKQMLTRIFVFLNYLVYTDTHHNTSASSSLRFLHQLCDTIVVFKMESHFSHLLLLHVDLCRNILAILVLIVTQIPDNAHVVSSILRPGDMDTLTHIKSMQSVHIQDKLNALLYLMPGLREP